MAEDRRSIQITNKIRWPKGKHPNKFRNKIKKHSDQLLNGKILAIDPASGSTSMPGWALFEAGKLIASGTIELTKSQPVQKRLNSLFMQLSQGWGHPAPDVVIIEEIRGSMAHAFLFWACGVSAAAFADSDIIEIPVSFWKAIVPEGYVKADDTDAMYIGLATIMLAKECNESTSN